MPKPKNKPREKKLPVIGVPPPLVRVVQIITVTDYLGSGDEEDGAAIRRFNNKQNELLNDGFQPNGNLVMSSTIENNGNVYRTRIAQTFVRLE